MLSDVAKDVFALEYASAELKAAREVWCSLPRHKMVLRRSSVPH